VSRKGSGAVPVAAPESPAGAATQSPFEIPDLAAVSILPKEASSSLGETTVKSASDSVLAAMRLDDTISYHSSILHAMPSPPTLNLSPSSPSEHQPSASEVSTSGSDRSGRISHRPYAPAFSPSYSRSIPEGSTDDTIPKSIGGGDAAIRSLNQRLKPRCWEHGCSGRQFSTFSNLIRHQRAESEARDESESEDAVPSIKAVKVTVRSYSSSSPGPDPLPGAAEQKPPPDSRITIDKGKGRVTAGTSGDLVQNQRRAPDSGPFSGHARGPRDGNEPASSVDRGGYSQVRNFPDEPPRLHPAMTCYPQPSGPRLPSEHTNGTRDGTGRPLPYGPNHENKTKKFRLNQVAYAGPHPGLGSLRANSRHTDRSRERAVKALFAPDERPYFANAPADKGVEPVFTDKALLVMAIFQARPHGRHLEQIVTWIRNTFQCPRYGDSGYPPLLDGILRSDGVFFEVGKIPFGGGHSTLGKKIHRARWRLQPGFESDLKYMANSSGGSFDPVKHIEQQRAELVSRYAKLDSSDSSDNDNEEDEQTSVASCEDEEDNREEEEADSPLPTTSAADDTAIRQEPSQHVDYLSYDWREEDVWSSWRHIVSQRRVYGQQSRLENAAWRIWAKSKLQLPTISPETLDW
jgi:hypothetical protein